MTDKISYADRNALVQWLLDELEKPLTKEALAPVENTIAELYRSTNTPQEDPNS